MNIKKALKLSFIGGLSGGFATLILYIYGLSIKTHSLAADLIINGFIFIIVGTGIMFSLIAGTSHLREKQTKLLIGGMIGGFCTGIFYNFFIGLYIGILILSISITSVFIVLRIPNALRILFGGILEGYGSVSLMMIPIAGWSLIDPIMQNHIPIIPVIFSTAINIYFIDFGMLVGLLSKE